MHEQLAFGQGAHNKQNDGTLPRQVLSSAPILAQQAHEVGSEGMNYLNTFFLNDFACNVLDFQYTYFDSSVGNLV